MWQQSGWAIRYLAAALTTMPTLPGYVDVGVIPQGARDILVKEVEEAGNFLALRNVESDEYFLNGNYIIQWNGEYEAGGTTFFYDRSGNLENLTASGPTNQPVMLQVGHHINGAVREHASSQLIPSFTVKLQCVSIETDNQGIHNFLT